jgi:hypothetical protein
MTPGNSALASGFLHERVVAHITLHKLSESPFTVAYYT